MDVVDEIDHSEGKSLSQFEYQRVQLDHSSAVARAPSHYHLPKAPADTSVQHVQKRIKSAQVARPAYFALGTAMRRGLPPSQRHPAGVVQPNETDGVVIDNFTVLSVVVGLLPCKLVHTRGKEVRLASLLLADPSRCNVKLTLWDQKCDWLESKVAALEVGDIVVITGLSCSVWQGSVGLKTGWRAACACLHRQQAGGLGHLVVAEELEALADTAFEAGQSPPALSSGAGTSSATPSFSESLRPYVAWFTGCDEGRAEVAQVQQWARQNYPALYRATTSTGPAAQEGASLPALTQGSGAVVPLSGRLITSTSDLLSRAHGHPPPTQHPGSAAAPLASQYAAGLSSAPPFFTPSVTQASLVRAGWQWPSTGSHPLVSHTHTGQPVHNNITLLCTVLTVEEIAGPEAVYTVFLGAAAGVTSLRRVHVTCAPLGSPGQPLTLVVWCFAAGPVRAGAVTRPVKQVINAADPQRDVLGDRALVSYKRLLASLHACAGTDEPFALTHLSLGQSPFLAAASTTAAGGNALDPAMIGPVLVLHTGPATRVLRLPTASEIPVSWRADVSRMLGGVHARLQPHGAALHDTPAPVLGLTKQPLQSSRLPLAALPDRSSFAPSLPDGEAAASPRFTAASTPSLTPVSKHVLVVQESTLADAIVQSSVSVRQSPSPVHGLVLCCPARVSGWSMPTLGLGRQACPGNAKESSATAVPGMKAYLDYASLASPCGPSPLLCMRCAECAAVLTPAQHAGLTAPVYSCAACGPGASMPIWQYVSVWLRLSSCPPVPLEGQGGAEGQEGTGGVSTTDAVQYAVWAKLSTGALHALLAADDSGLSPDSLVQLGSTLDHPARGPPAGLGMGLQHCPPSAPHPGTAHCIDDTDTQPLEDTPWATTKGHDDGTAAVLDLLTSLLHPSSPAFTVILTGPACLAGSTSTDELPHSPPRLEGESPHWSVLDMTAAEG